MSRRMVLTGGFATNEQLLNPLAHAICDRYDLDDADVFTFAGAMKDSRELERAMKGQSAVAHSAGILAVSLCEASLGAEKVIALNGPEPKKISRLIGRTAVKNNNLVKEAALGPNRVGNARVAAHNIIEVARHPITHLRNIDDISRFSTADTLRDMRLGGVAVARIDTSSDELFGPYVERPWDGQRLVISGRHDQALIDPEAFVSQLPDDLFEMQNQAIDKAS